MRSLPSVIKPAFVTHSEKKVAIPDLPRKVVVDENGTEIVPVLQMPTQEEIDAVYRLAAQRGEKAGQSALAKSLGECGDLIAKAREESEEIRQEAYKEGYAQGKGQCKEDILHGISTLTALMAQLEAQEQDYLQDYATQLKFFALEIASKILHQKVQEDPIVLTRLVEQALSTVKNAQWITVQVSDQLPALVDHLAQHLTKRELQDIPLTVEERPLPGDGVVIETSEGSVVASISVQLENLRELLGETLAG